MFKLLDKSIAIIVRTTGESTTKTLIGQLRNQLTSKDILFVRDDEECFEDKLKHGFELGVAEARPFTVFIDADILLRRNAVKQIKKIIEKLESSDLGFGLRLWDRFYDRPKFRGLHVYRTALLDKAISMVPEPNLELRPESYVKQKLKEEGHVWRNDISYYVAGIHDYFQKAEDIYYKFLVRTKRSEQDIIQLKQKFRLSNDLDFKIALRGLQDGERMTDVSNNKYLYKQMTKKILELEQEPTFRNQSVDAIILKKLANYYRFNRLFWSSI